MIPPSPLQFALWGSALYNELAAGLWRALATPWLEPGWPGSSRMPERRRAQAPRQAAAGAANREPASGRPGPVEAARPRPEPAEHRVIEVPRARWQGRRPTGGRSPDRR